jgi:hypothetical protein
MLSSEFLADFKRATEARWRELSINPAVYGFQFQRGTRWNPGLSEQEVTEYEAALGARFPHDFKAFLQAANGTDLPTLNVYGCCGDPPSQSVGVYSYPKDIEVLKRQIEDVRQCLPEVKNTLAEQGFDWPSGASLVPIYGHRYLVCSTNPESSVVLSILDGNDAIVYGDSLKEYLQREFLSDAP